ncbi:MAG TPA: hypothetical protein VGM50_22115 [Gemmatimonadaceae bacterium]
MENSSISTRGTDARAPQFVAPAPSAPLMWMLGFVNRWLLVRRYFRVHTIDFPSADRERLSQAVNKSTAAFLAPNHPEFGFDWMMDKELSTHVAPKMASWASHEIIETAPWFWRRNNLVPNNGGDDATRYSIEWALRGNGVLLHPEGMVHWTADRIHPLFPGVADMSIDAAREIERRGESRPTYIVPMIWKLRFTEDVSVAIHHEMSAIERGLDLPGGRGLRVADRFAELQHNILARQMARCRFDARSLKGLDVFNQQNAFRAWLVAELQSRYCVQLADTMERTIHRLRREIVSRATETMKKDLALATEADRLGGFTRELYDTPMLSQEQLFESLKRHRATLIRTGFRNVAHNFLPKPYGARIAHVRVPDPIPIDATRTRDDVSRAAYVRELLAETRARMQSTVDAINVEAAVEGRAFSHQNPFAAHGAARAA